MGRITQEYSVEGRVITVGDIRALADWATDHEVPDTEEVDVEVAPRYPNPSDPGGEIRLTVTQVLG